MNRQALTMRTDCKALSPAQQRLLPSKGANVHTDYGIPFTTCTKAQNNDNQKAQRSATPCPRAQARYVAITKVGRPRLSAGPRGLLANRAIRIRSSAAGCVSQQEGRKTVECMQSYSPAYYWNGFRLVRVLLYEIISVRGVCR